MLVTGTLERNGLKESAAKLIGKIKNASAGAVIGAYGVMRSIFAAFNISFMGSRFCPSDHYANGDWFN